MSKKFDEILSKVRMHDKDFGSSAVQIIQLYYRIQKLDSHLNYSKKSTENVKLLDLELQQFQSWLSTKSNKHDHPAQRKIKKLSADLKTHMRYLHRHSPTNYKNLIDVSLQFSIKLPKITFND